VEINVAEQVKNLAKTDIIQRAWLDKQRPILHGWIYNLRTGYLNELTRMQAGDNLNETDHFQAQQQVGRLNRPTRHPA
jgi:carbonic anhydrase